MWRATLTLVLLSLVCAPARAQGAPGAVLWEAPGLRPELCGALRIQFSGLAEVECLADEASGAPLPTRLARAATQVSARGATLGVLLERDADARFLRLYLVAARSDRAVLAVESIEARPDRDIDRGLSLKVVEVFETLQEAKQKGVSALSTALVQPGEAVPQAAQEPAPSAAPGMALAGFAEASAGLRTGPKLTATFSVLLGLALSRERVRFDLGLGADLETPFEVRASSRRVRVAERGPVLELRLVRRLGAVELGGNLRARWAFASAEGTALDGTSGARLLHLPYLGVGLELRVPLTPRLWLRLAPAIDVSLIDQHYEVDDITLVEAKLVRFTLPLSVGFDGLR